jgi:WXG100 family type VII secretion target
MADQIRYEYGALEEGVAAMRRTTDQLQQLVDQLRQQTQGVRQSWDASAAQTYEQLSQKINQDFGNMNEMLGKLQQATQQGGQDMGDQDKKLAKSFDQ